MLCGKRRNSTEIREIEEKKKSEEIDNQIKIWHKEESPIIKLLLLGTGEAGKTTIIKQMKILHINGFSESERRERIVDIQQNIHESIYDLIRHMSVLIPSIPFQYEKSEEAAKYIMDMGENQPAEFTDEYYDNVEHLWSDLGVKECYVRSNEFQLIDCAKYFLQKINEIRQPNYLPTEQDILYCRKKTTVITKVEFTMKAPKSYGGGSQKFWMFDVGGQRGYRRKWIQVFAGIHAVLFLVASNDFDQTLREDRECNRLLESIKLFENVWRNRFLMDSGFIIFLNKQDLLREKIDCGKRITNYFPEYEDFQISEKDGNPFDVFDRTRCFIRHKFMEITQKRTTVTHMVAGRSILEENVVNRECFFHFTTATNTKNIKRVFDDVHSMILASNMSKVGIF
ncbi:G protein alpha f subunit [Carabus blaptoides fortunei]